MKKLRIKLPGRKKQTVPMRITNETVAEHREHILTGGRRFKYPMQYARHRLVINTIAVTAATVLIVLAVAWQQLYIAQNTSDFFYRVTRIVPVPVASVDGSLVSYGDYLMYFSSSRHYLVQSEQLNISSADGKRQIDYIKRKSLDNVIADAYARKIATERKLTVTDDRIDSIVSKDRDTANGRISQETYDASALNILGWTPNEYRKDIKSKLLRQDVSYAIDDKARVLQQKAVNLIASTSGDFDAVAKQLGGEGVSKVTAGVSGFVPLANKDGGLSAAAATLTKGQVSSAIKSTSGTGYFFVKLLDRTDTQVSYAYLQVPLTEFDARVQQLKADKKIKEYIDVPAVNDQSVVK
jgi:hypothetical protein